MTPKIKQRKRRGVHNPKLWIMRVPVVSTAHIERDTLETLASSFRVIETDEGAFVWIGTEIRSNAPAEMKRLIEWFTNEFPEEWWIRIDRDGDVIPGLPVYEW